LGDLAEVGRDCRRAKDRDCRLGLDVKAGLAVGERPALRRRDAPRWADLIAVAQQDAALLERCLFAMEPELDARADRAGGRQVLRQQVALPAWKPVERQASQELAQRLERELRQQVLVLRELQPEPARQARLVSLQEVQQRGQAPPQAFLRQPSLRRRSPLFLPLPSLQRRPRPAPDPE